MRIAFRQFLARSHSWSIIGQNLARALIKQSYNVDLFSTNGIQYFPDDLKPNLIGYIEDNKVYGRLPDTSYDATISYTAPKNAPVYLQHSAKNRFLIFAFEWPLLPSGFAKHHSSTDLILAPSNFARDCFINSKVPPEKVVVIPHGINQEQFNNTAKYPLKTKKATKIFVNIGQSHRRKNIDGIFKSYCAAFTKKDDVCLVAKISKCDLTSPFEVDAVKIMNNARAKYGNNAPEIEMITGYVENIAELFNACNIVFAPAHCEGFGLVPLEAVFAGKVSVCSRYSGPIDFLDDSVSVLVDGKIAPAPPNHQYWDGNIKNTHFVPDLSDMIDKLRFAVANHETLNEKVKAYRETIREKYSWDTIAKQITSLCR